MIWYMLYLLTVPPAIVGAGVAVLVGRDRIRRAQARAQALATRADLEVRAAWIEPVPPFTMPPPAPRVPVQRSSYEHTEQRRRVTR